MKILVTGGTGFLGRALTKKLRKANYDINVVSRRAPDKKNRIDGVAYHQCDLSRETLSREVMKDVSVVFHAAAKAGVGGRYSDYYAANFIATKNILRASESSSVSAFIYTSSPSVVFSGKPVQNGDESLPYVQNKISPYSHTKALAEKMVLESNHSDTFQTLALRPHLFWGKGDPHLLPKVISRHREKKLRIVGDGNNLVDLTHIENVVHAHLLAMERLLLHQNLGGNPYFIGQDEPISLWGWLNELFPKLDLPPLKKCVSFRKAYSIGKITEIAWKALGLRREIPMTRFVACQLAQDHWFSNEAAKRDLGYYPVISMEDALEKTIPWLRTL